MTPAAHVVGVSCLSPLGLWWRGCSSRARQADSPGTGAVAIENMPQHLPREERLAERLMSRAALLGHLACRAAIADAGWDAAVDRSDVGMFMGVGASGGATTQLEAMLSHSIDEDGAFSLERFGSGGLRACNPLYAFQLMNNFAMCHAAILSRVQGPNMALFSRGGGTVCALAEALYALHDADEDCRRALVGGADCATDPVTAAELTRAGFVAEGLVPAEGAAMLALAADDRAGSLAAIERCEFAPIGKRGLRAALAAQLPEPLPEVDAVVITGWGPAVRQQLRAQATELCPRADIVDATRAVGDSLAASPAIGWVIAVDLLQNASHRRALVLSCGVDDELGVVVMHDGEAP